jgi:hypothetical protein
MDVREKKVNARCESANTDIHARRRFGKAIASFSKVPSGMPCTLGLDKNPSRQ